MVFSSAIFVFAFLPVVFLVCLLPIPVRGKNAVLIMASLFFYAFGEPFYVCLMLVSTIVNYGFGRLLGASCSWKRYRRAILWVAVILNIGILGVFKYTAFILCNIKRIFGVEFSISKISLPIGISFFTFQALSYVIDVYRKAEMEQKNYFALLLYISFFPQLVAGPIIKYSDFEPQIYDRKMDTDVIVSGIMRFSKGLFKKMVFANAFGQMADAIFALDIEKYSFFVAWLGAVSYTLQIYYDFSGYSDMAIGMAGMFGFHFHENFNHPYGACSIQEFWRKWHISLSTWFREYVYIPLGGNRKGKARTEFNKMIVFVLTGIWHGANWTFVMWGLLHGIVNVLEDTVLPVRRYKGRGFHIVGNLYTWLVVTVAFVFFRSDSVTYGLRFVAAMFHAGVSRASLSLAAEQMTPYAVCVLFLGILGSYPVTGWLKERLSIRWKYYEQVQMVGSMLMLVLSIFQLASAAYNPFIYFRF